MAMSVAVLSLRRIIASSAVLSCNKPLRQGRNGERRTYAAAGTANAINEVGQIVGGSICTSPELHPERCAQAIVWTNLEPRLIAVGAALGSEESKTARYSNGHSPTTLFRSTIHY